MEQPQAVVTTPVVPIQDQIFYVTIQKQDDVDPLNEKQYDTVLAFAQKYDMDSCVHVFQTIHGHIALIKRKEGRFVPGSEGIAARMDMEDFQFLSEMNECTRWVEMATDHITIGLTASDYPPQYHS